MRNIEKSMSPVFIDFSICVLFECINKVITRTQIEACSIPVKPSGEIKTIVVPQKQKIGDICVFERYIKYDLDKKYKVLLSSKIFGKILKWEKTPHLHARNSRARKI